MHVKSALSNMTSSHLDQPKYVVSSNRGILWLSLTSVALIVVLLNTVTPALQFNVFCLHGLESKRHISVIINDRSTI